MARSDAAGPYNLDALRAVPAPSLFERDPAALKQQLVTWFEGETGRTLYPMQVEMLLIDMVAYLWSIIHSDAQIAHEQRYVTLAAMDWLRHLGAQPGVETPPLSAAHAVTTLRFALAAPIGVAVLVPAGTRVSAGSDETVFLTDADLVIAAGATIGDVGATAQEAGAAANGLLTGQANALLDPIAGVATVGNLGATAGGADAETPDAYRLRLANALEKAAISGQRMGYVEHAMALSSSLIDCAAIRPRPCYIDLYPLTAQGAASPALRDVIKAAIDDLQEHEILPMGDLVTVKAVEDVVIPLRWQVWLASADDAVVAAAKSALIAATAPYGQQLAPEIVPQDVRDKARLVPGVVNIETPGFAYRKLAAHQRAVIEVYPPDVSVRA